eukprot:scaffold67477_cov45-Phaeocystis_antarctica.AAC.2
MCSEMRTCTAGRRTRLKKRCAMRGFMLEAKSRVASRIAAGPGSGSGLGSGWNKWLRHVEDLLPVGKLWDDLEGLGQLARAVGAEEPAHALVHLDHLGRQLGHKLLAFPQVSRTVLARRSRLGALRVLLDLLHDNVRERLRRTAAHEQVERALVALVQLDVLRLIVLGRHLVRVVRVRVRVRVKG